MSNEKNEALNAMIDFMINLHEAMVDSILDLRCGDLTRLNSANSILEGIQWLSEFGRFSTDLDFVAKNMAELVSALEREDYVLFADILEYEFEPLIRKWGEIADSMYAEEFN